MAIEKDPAVMEKRILLTGSSGFLGSHLYQKLRGKGWSVYGLSRHGPDLVGEVTKPGLGLNEVPKLDAVFHNAASVALRDSQKASTWETNVIGTQNVLQFCLDHGIRQLLFTSTAYTDSRNPYEESKAACERQIREASARNGISATIFKPSLIVGDGMRRPLGLYEVVLIIARIHRRLEPLRKWVEGTLRLPPLEAAFRLTGDPDAILDMVPVEWVARQMASIEGEGTYWLTNPMSPTISQLADWVGELLWLHITVHPEPFTASVIEAMFQRAARPFLPYLRQGPRFEPSVPRCPPIDREYVQKSLLENLLHFGV